MLLPPAGVEQDLSLLQCPQRRGMGLSSCWVSLQLLSITTGRSFSEEKKIHCILWPTFILGIENVVKKEKPRTFL